MTLTDEMHGPVTRGIAAGFRADPFNNVGRWCDISRTTAVMFAEDFGVPLSGRGWAVRGYVGQDGCGCHLYHLSHEMLPGGIVATFNRAPGNCQHTEMMNLY